MNPIDFISEKTAISKAAILSNLRQSKVVEARHIAMWLVRRTQPELTFMAIGKMFNCHHTTVLHAIKKVKNLTHVYKNYKHQLVNWLMEYYSREQNCGVE